ncbi:hypothetical protein Tco_1166249 [Tanacetum coccineum]
MRDWYANRCKCGEEVEAQVREMMDGAKGEKMRSKALEWKKKAKEAVVIRLLAMVQSTQVLSVAPIAQHSVACRACYILSHSIPALTGVPNQRPP